MAISIAHYMAAMLLAATFYLVWKFNNKGMAQQEPPTLHPRIPLIGHIIGLMQHEASYFTMLRTKTDKSIITMPMLNKKTYFIFSPHLAQQAFRDRNLDFDLVGLAFARSVAAISEQAMAERVKKGPNTYSTETVAAIKSGLTGQNLYDMNSAMLAHVASNLNAIHNDTDSKGLQLPSLWLWLRDMMTMATVEAFYGSANPFRADPTGLDALWDFDEGLPAMLFMPPALARAGARSRDRVVQTLRPFFNARLDRGSDVSAFVALRTEVSMRHNVVGDDLCKGEVINIWVSTANSIPALFWTLIYVWLCPGLVEELRQELTPFVTFSTKEHGKRKAVFDIRLVEKNCPLLISCQREGVRVANHMVSRRAIIDDTVLTDEDGTTYLLKKGVHVMWSAKVTHEMPEVWGPDAHEFNPRRFMNQETLAGNKDTEKKRRAAYMPFGSGAHLCPGRNFAFAEILGLIGALILGYEIEGLRPERIKMGPRVLAAAIPKPMENGGDGGPVILRRKDGWEDVEWSFAC